MRKSSTGDVITQFIRGNRHVIEGGKLLTIALFALLSLAVSIYFLYFSVYAGFRFVYVFIPHLYLIPIILLALWYPKSGVKLVIVILGALVAFWFFADTLGYTFPPFFMILYTGIDLAFFVVFLLYVKDRRLVEAVILDLIERREMINKKRDAESDHRSQDFDTIISSLGSSNEIVREDAVSALAELGDTRGVFPLITALKDVSSHVRRSAVEGLGRTGNFKVVRPLIESLADPDRYVRETAAEALGHLGSIAHPELIKELYNPDWRIRLGIVVALRVSSDFSDTDQVIRLLHDESIFVRREAVKTLGRIGDNRVFPYLVEATRDVDPGVRLRAVRGVAKIGSGDEVRQILTRCMQDPDSAVRLRAGEELQKTSL